VIRMNDWLASRAETDPANPANQGRNPSTPTSGSLRR